MAADDFMGTAPSGNKKDASILWVQLQLPTNLIDNIVELSMLRHGVKIGRRDAANQIKESVFETANETLQGIIDKVSERVTEYRAIAAQKQAEQKSVSNLESLTGHATLADPLAPRRGRPRKNPPTADTAKGTDAGATEIVYGSPEAQALLQQAKASDSAEAGSEEPGSTSRKLSDADVRKAYEAEHGAKAGEVIL